jgi:hypothetical protein
MFRKLILLLPSELWSILCLVHCLELIRGQRLAPSYGPIRLFNRFEVFRAVTVKNAVFLDVAPCRYCVNRYFRGTYRLHLQGLKIRERGTSVSRWLQPGSSLADFYTLKMESIRSSETFYTIYTRPHIPEDGTLQVISYFYLTTEAEQSSETFFLTQKQDDGNFPTCEVCISLEQWCFRSYVRLTWCMGHWATADSLESSNLSCLRWAPRFSEMFEISPLQHGVSSRRSI